MIYLLLFPCITETWELECKVMYLLVTKLANDRASIYPGSLTPLFVLFNTVQYYLLRQFTEGCNVSKTNPLCDL